jgi:hypothetical protein
MNDIQILKLKAQGYCCSQIMVCMVLDLMDKENRNLVDFAGGLCMGGGMEEGPCGILTAGMCILALYAKKDKDRLALMQESFLSFFRTAAPKGIGCRQITGDRFPELNPATCGPLLAAAYSQMISILAENGFDPTDISYD